MDDNEKLELLDDNDLLRILLYVLFRNLKDSKEPEEKPVIDEWSISIKDLIPDIGNSYFWYYKNTGEKTVTFTDFKFSSTLEGTNTTNIYVHRVSGIPEFKNEKDLKPVKITNTDLFPEAEIKTTELINDLEDLGLIDRLNLPYKFIVEHLKTNIEVAPNEAICLKWEEPTGAITGTIIVNKER